MVNLLKLKFRSRKNHMYLKPWPMRCGRGGITSVITTAADASMNLFEFNEVQRHLAIDKEAEYKMDYQLDFRVQKL